MASIAARALRLAIREALARAGPDTVDRLALQYLAQLGRILFFLLAFAFYAHLIPPLRALGTALLTSLGVASVVVGLAAQSALGNLISGISLVLYRPFEVDDRVQVAVPGGLETGVVERLTLGYTVLRTDDKRRIVVPNSVMATQVTINLQNRDAEAPLALRIGVARGSDLALVRRILLELAAAAHPDVTQVLDCPVTQLGSGAVVLTLRARCPNAGAAERAEFKLYEEIKRRLEEAGVEIAFPYGEVVLRRT